MQESDVIALHVVHVAAHARKTLAEPKVICGIVFGRFALRPVPPAAILYVHYVDGVIVHDGAAGLNAKIVHAAQALLKDLWRHNGGTY